MTVTAYFSTDASAPSLTGQTGSLVALLDAILVNGYGSKSAAGWTIAFTGTSKRDYKQGSGSNGYYLDIDDSGPGGGSFREARMRGYEAMTALGTGTLPFPTTAQASTGVYCRKSTTADSTARPWYCVADATCFHLFVDTGDVTAPSYSFTFSFGDFFSYKTSDIYNTAIIGRWTENSGSGGADALGHLAGVGSGANGGLSSYTNLLTGAAQGHFVDRNWTGVGGSLGFLKHSSILSGLTANNGCCGSSNAVCVYPNGPDGAMELAPFWIGHSGSVRGYLKGLWVPCHNQPCGHGDTFSGTGNMSGKSFLALNIQSANFSAAANGQIVVETSNTWS